MKKRALDKAYEEIDAKYKDMSEEDMKKEMETLKKEITGKEKALENLDGEAREKMKKDLEKKNIKWVSFGGIDNVLLKNVDNFIFLCYYIICILSQMYTQCQYN